MAHAVRLGEAAYHTGQPQVLREVSVRPGAVSVTLGGRMSQLCVLTVGHSTRSLEEFIALLRAHGVEHLVDVRTMPRSRRSPQFNRDTLPAALAAHGMGYTHLPSLGGLRHAHADSPNMAWRNASFRGYADYMASREFAAGLDELLALASQQQVAIMCAEAVPWRCHRSLIADALMARGVAVEDIFSPTRRASHRLTPFARIEGTRITYPSVATGAPEEGSAGTSQPSSARA